MSAHRLGEAGQSLAVASETVDEEPRAWYLSLRERTELLLGERLMSLPREKEDVLLLVAIGARARSVDGSASIVKTGVEGGGRSARARMGLFGGRAGGACCCFEVADWLSADDGRVDEVRTEDVSSP